MFAKEIQHSVHMEPVERHGDLPLLMSCRDRQDEVLKIKKKLDVFLKSDYEVQLISPDSTRFINGISVTSIQMSKGLEFDQVVIGDGDDQTYHTEYDRSLLYIAATRVMHKPDLLYSGVPSRFLLPKA